MTFPHFESIPIASHKRKFNEMSQLHDTNHQNGITNHLTWQTTLKQKFKSKQENQSFKITWAKFQTRSWTQC